MLKVAPAQPVLTVHAPCSPRPTLKVKPDVGSDERAWSTTVRGTAAYRDHIRSPPPRSPRWSTSPRARHADEGSVSPHLLLEPGPWSPEQRDLCASKGLAGHVEDRDELLLAAAGGASVYSTYSRAGRPSSAAPRTSSSASPDTSLAVASPTLGSRRPATARRPRPTRLCTTHRVASDPHHCTRVPELNPEAFTHSAVLGLQGPALLYEVCARP